MGVSSSSWGCTPLSLDGWFHGKSHLLMDDDWGYPYFRKQRLGVWVLPGWVAQRFPGGGLDAGAHQTGGGGPSDDVDILELSSSSRAVLSHVFRFFDCVLFVVFFNDVQCLCCYVGDADAAYLCLFNIISIFPQLVGKTDASPLGNKIYSSLTRLYLARLGLKGTSRGFIDLSDKTLFLPP